MLFFLHRTGRARGSPAVVGVRPLHHGDSDDEGALVARRGGRESLPFHISGSTVGMTLGGGLFVTVVGSLIA